MISQVVREGKSVILVSSEMQEVMSVADRIVVMHEGRVTGILKRDEFSQEAVMRLSIKEGAAKLAYPGRAHHRDEYRQSQIFVSQQHGDTAHR